MSGRGLPIWHRLFFDENDILKDSKDPDLDYNQLIRPWKSRLGILYVNQRSLWLDFQLIFLTAATIVSRATALDGVTRILNAMNAPPELIQVSRRQDRLVPSPPPGSDEVVQYR